MFSTLRKVRADHQRDNEGKLHILVLVSVDGQDLVHIGCETILFSGRNDNLRRQGVPLILKRDVEKSFLEWKPFNERLIKARFLLEKQVTMTVIQCYPLT